MGEYIGQPGRQWQQSIQVTVEGNDHQSLSLPMAGALS